MALAATTGRGGGVKLGGAAALGCGFLAALRLLGRSWP
jgi:hypothetical protein